jgi:hypothetical protein
MQTWVTVVTPLAVAILTVAVNAVVNIKIKFAPNAEAPTREVKALVLRALQWLLNLVTVGALINNVVSGEPVTRLAVFTIALQVAVLGLIVAFYLIERIIWLSPAHGGDSDATPRHHEADSGFLVVAPERRRLGVDSAAPA